LGLGFHGFRGFYWAILESFGDPFKSTQKFQKEILNPLCTFFTIFAALVILDFSKNHGGKKYSNFPPKIKENCKDD
jgi:hypothetical protein